MYWKKFVSYQFANYYFMDDMLTAEDYEAGGFDPSIPPYMHMSRHVMRANHHPLSLSKSITRTSEAKTLYSHYPTSCLRGYCERCSVPTSLAFMAHYRAKCQRSIPDCDNYMNHTVTDKTVLRWRDRLMARVLDTLDQVGLLGP